LGIIDPAIEFSRAITPISASSEHNRFTTSEKLNNGIISIGSEK
jgi:hypothetical protein